MVLDGSSLTTAVKYTFVDIEGKLDLLKVP